MACSPTARAATAARAAAPAARTPCAPPARTTQSLQAPRAACEPVEAILFDMDGVLTLSEELSRQ
jgi:hypothetical protein